MTSLLKKLSIFIKIGIIKRYGVCLVSFKIVDRIRRQSSSVANLFTPLTPTRQNSFVASASASAVCIGLKVYYIFDHDARVSTHRHTRWARWQSLSPTVDHSGTAYIVHSRHRPYCVDSRRPHVPDAVSRQPPRPPSRQRRAGRPGTATRDRYTCIGLRRPRRPGRSGRTHAGVSVVCVWPVDVPRPRYLRPR